jgi:rRNA-processing protein FCF1
MQLPPIVKLNNPIYNSWNVNAQVEGLTTYALGSSVKSYRIVTTFRLTEKSAQLTKIFYGNRFLSVKEEYHDFSEAKSIYMPNEGGVICCCTGDVKNGVYSETADQIINEVISKIEKYYPYLKVAVITPFRYTVQELQKRFSRSDMELDITIETVDRIQGMTVDYAIFYIPGRNPGFALETRRFNVATSRSKSTTLIITDFAIEQLGNFHSSSPIVMDFLAHCDQINNGTLIAHEKIDQPTLVDNVCAKPEAQVEPEIFKIEVPKIGTKQVGFIDPSTFERPKKELKADKKNYYIIDTNVFVNCPDIISKIDKKYPIILSAKVTDELDKMKIKLDERGKQNAEKALRLLNNESSREIIYEFADTSLLPDDFDKRSPDNMILSVALKYKDENPIMLTSDNGLQLKSKILKISTISLKNFLKR